MIIKSIFKNTLLGLGGAVVAMSPFIATVSCGASTSGFDKNKIGIYVEQGWIKTFENAKTEYEKVAGRTEIQFLVNQAFDAVGLVDTLGYNDQKVADLIYMPLDRIPVLSQDKKALMAFETPELLTAGMEDSIFDTDGNAVVSVEERQAFADLGKGHVGSKDAYFAFNHNVEALIAYTKGTATSSTTLDEIFKNTDTDGWKNSMYSSEFFNLWPSLGFVAGFLGINDGSAVGKALIDYNPVTKKYISDMANIADEALNTTGNTLKLKELVTFIAEAINGAVKNGQDWMALGGDTFFAKTETLFKTKTNGLIIDGPWNKNKWAADGVDVKAVPNIIGDKVYTQAPGGWVYGINARNSKDPKRVTDMKDFLDILLTDKKIITEQYNNIGKVIAGAEAKKILSTDITEEFDKKLIAAVYEGVANSMNARPDNGNSTFSNVWSAWDEAGFRDKATQNILLSKDKFNVNAVIKNIAKSFQNILQRLNK